jgi:hypothetical protein
VMGWSWMEIGLGWWWWAKQVWGWWWRMVNWLRRRARRNDDRPRMEFNCTSARVIVRGHTIGRDMGPSRDDSGPDIPCIHVDAVPTRRCGVQTSRQSQHSRRQW